MIQFNCFCNCSCQLFPRGVERRGERCVCVWGGGGKEWHGNTCPMSIAITYHALCLRITSTKKSTDIHSIKLGYCTTRPLETHVYFTFIHIFNYFSCIPKPSTQTHSIKRDPKKLFRVNIYIFLRSTTILKLICTSAYAFTGDLLHKFVFRCKCSKRNEK